MNKDSLRSRGQAHGDLATRPVQCKAGQGHQNLCSFLATNMGCMNGSRTIANPLAHVLPIKHEMTPEVIHGHRIGTAAANLLTDPPNICFESCGHFLDREQVRWIELNYASLRGLDPFLAHR